MNICVEKNHLNYTNTCIYEHIFKTGYTNYNFVYFFENAKHTTFLNNVLS